MNIPDNIDFKKYLADISVLEQLDMHWADHWSELLTKRITDGKKIIGERLPWDKTQHLFRLRQGELTIWAGTNGHRKSMLVGQVMAWLAQRSKVCIASLEMRPEETLLRMCRQVAGCHPSVDFARRFAEWGRDRICIYDQLDTVEAMKILGMVHYAAKELGCRHVVIDSLTKCGLDEEDYRAEKKFIDRLQWAAKHYRIHVHLVCHMRKGMSEDRIPNKYDIKGSGAITDLADNVVICWKNKLKEDASRKKNQKLTPAEVESLEKPDQLIDVIKQRNGDWEGKIALWFREDGLQFVESERSSAPPIEIKAEI